MKFFKFLFQSRRQTLLWESTRFSNFFGPFMFGIFYIFGPLEASEVMVEFFEYFFRTLRAIIHRNQKNKENSKIFQLVRFSGFLLNFGQFWCF
jgi:hypothetical protein